MAYTGHLSTLSKCSLCGLERTNHNQKQFQILSPKQLLTTRFSSKSFCHLLNYKRNLSTHYNKITDIWDSKLIKQLKKEEITIDGKRMGSKHFEDFRESAIGLATDGIGIFKS